MNALRLISNGVHLGLTRSPLQEPTFTRAHSSFRQSEIGMPVQIPIITSVEGAEDGLARFTSLVKARV